jgi:two-component system NtrC family response regulator
MTKSILIVEDDRHLTKVLTRILAKEGYEVDVSHSVREGIEKLSKEMPGVVLTDFYLPDGTGVEILKHAMSLAGNADVIVMTANATVESAIQAMKMGARDYLLKPFLMDELILQMEKIFQCRAVKSENFFLKEGLKNQYGLSEIAGKSPRMQELSSLIESVSNSRSSVLIQGESGTGKELIARAIHFGGNRAEKMFVPINCSAIPENLLESELFGHVKGAYTGAAENKRGLFEHANKGTLFLDEIGDLSHALQAKLLRVLEDGRIRRVGDYKEIENDARIVAATNKDISELIKKGAFREDLYFRLAVIPIFVPPLRERREDIRLLADHFIRHFDDGRRPVVRIGTEAMEVLTRYDWPGNVRELKNLIERLSILRAGKTITPEDLPSEIHGPEVLASWTQGKGLDYQKAKEKLLEEFHRRFVADALKEHGGNISRASGSLGLDRRNFQRIMRRYGLQSSDYRVEA